MRKKLSGIFKPLGFIFFLSGFFYPLDTRCETPVEKKKVITKSFALSKSDKILLSNKYGEMKLSTWDKPEIKITITIHTNTATQKRSDDILDAIFLESGKTGNGINCITRFKNNFASANPATKNDEYSINYEVFLPAYNPLSVTNEFGTTIIPDYFGEAEIISRHGILKTGRINNAREVSVEFGKGEIFHVNNGHITIRYSTVEINKLSGDITARFEFADSVRISMDNDINSLQIDNTYSTLYLDLARSFSAKFRVHAQLNGVMARGGINLNEEVINKVDRLYTATVGKGERMIDVNSKFGKVIIGQYYVYRKTTVTSKQETQKTEKTTRKSN